MIKALIITNKLKESIRLDLRNPWSTGLAVRGVTGLAPVKADINMTNLATTDGSRYNSSRANNRNVVIYFSFVGDIDAARKKTYKYFPLKEKVKVSVETDEDVYFVEGYVESNEGVIFSDKTGTQVSIVCQDSYLKSEAVYSTVVSGIQNEFTFPFSNESISEDLIEFGVVRSNNGVNTVYDGDKACGLYISIKASGTVENLMFYNASTREFMKIDTAKLTELTGSAIIAGDVIEINTNKGEKEMLLFRDGEYTNIINTLDRESTWLELQKGDNVFAYTADTGMNVVAITVRYRKLYEGV